MKLFNTHLLKLALAALLLATSSVQAAPLFRALSVVIDGSGSINAADFQLQKDAYAAVFSNSSILKADGSVAINVIQFSDEGAGIIEQTALRIDTEADRTTLINAINAMAQIDGNTDIQEGINLGVTNMDAFLGGVLDFATGFRKIVDVSTDGQHNEPGDPAAESQNAVNNLGYSDVNCLGVGGGADCSFNDGVGQDFSANSFAELLPVLEAKVREELVPLPGTLLLLVAGLLGGGLLRLGRKQ